MALLRGIKSIPHSTANNYPIQPTNPAPGIDENYRKPTRYIEATKEVNLVITIRIHGADFAGMEVHLLCAIFLDGRAACDFLMDTEGLGPAFETQYSVTGMGDKRAFMVKIALN